MVRYTVWTAAAARADRIAGDLVGYGRKIWPETADCRPAVPRCLPLRRIVPPVVAEE
jgi:hypothetical protein